MCRTAPREGQRSGAFRIDLHGPRAKSQDHCAWRNGQCAPRELIEYADRHGIPVTATKAKPDSTDPNLFHISYEGGILEDPWESPPDEIFQMTVSPEKAPDKPREVEIEYHAGNPVAVDGKKMSPATLLAHLNKLGGAHGIGRVDLVENRYVGMKSRGVYETPGGTILHMAHRGLESLTMDREVLHFRDSLIPRFADLIYNGYWFSPEREMIQTAIDEAQKDVSGIARVKLYKGSCTLAGRKSKQSLYRLDIATFEEDDVYDQKDGRLHTVERLATEDSRANGKLRLINVATIRIS